MKSQSPAGANDLKIVFPKRKNTSNVWQTLGDHGGASGENFVHGKHTRRVFKGSILKSTQRFYTILYVHTFKPYVKIVWN